MLDNAGLSRRRLLCTSLTAHFCDLLHPDPHFRRYGVNGGGASVGLGLSQRMRGWLVDAMSSGKAVRSQPFGS